MRQKDKYFSIWIIILFLLFGYLGILNLIFRVPMDYIIKFIVMNIISIMVPGITMITFLDCKLSKITRLCLSYALGYALVVVEYFFCELFNRRISFTVCSISVFLICTFLLIFRIKKKKISLQTDNSSNDIIGVLFFCIIAFISVSVYSANYLGIESVPVVNLFHDMGFWCTNTVALKLNYPACRLWAYGSPLNYHYFSSIPIAFLSEIYDIDIYTMSFQLYSLTKTVLLVGSVQLVLDVFDAKKTNRIIAYIAFLLASGLEYMVNVTFVYYLYYRPFGFDYGYAYGIYFMALLIYQWKNKQFRVETSILTMLMWAMCVGGKGPIAAILIVFAGLICLYWLFEKNWKNAFVNGIGILGIFLIISYFCTGMFSINTGKTGSYSITLNTSLNTNTIIVLVICILLFVIFCILFGKRILSYAQNHKSAVFISIGGILLLSAIVYLCISSRHSHVIELSDRESMAKFVSIICEFTQKHSFLENLVCLFFTNPLLVLGMCMSVCISIVWYVKNKISFKDLFFVFSLCLSAIAGLVLGIILNVVGHSEMYFSMAAFIPMTCMVIELLQKLDETREKSWVILKRLVYSIIIIFIVIGIYNTNILYWKSNSIAYWAKRGYEITRGSFSDNDYYSSGIYNGIRDTDVEALRWIKDNTDMHDMLMVDKGTLTDIGQYYLYGIFAERQTYYEYFRDMPTINYSDISRKQLIKQVYENDPNALIMAKEEGVDYIVQTKDVTPGFTYDQNTLELMYSTETMNIYKVR